MFSGASNLAAGVDKAFAFIFTIALIFIVGITAFMIYTVIRFNRKKGKPAMQFSGSTKLEVIWTGVPLILVLLMFYFGWVGFAPMRKPPKDAMTVTAIGRKWEFEFDYGNGMKSKQLVLPVNKAVKINLRSEDVNHSLSIPAFRVKEDLIPGYNDFLWFIPSYVGTFQIFCSEYCGLLHSAMMSKAVILNQPDYDKWFDELKKTGTKPDHPGLIISRNIGCLACHSIDGSKLVGPTFKGLFGSVRNEITPGGPKTMTADSVFIKRAVYEPDAETAQGFGKSLMKSYRGTLSEADLRTVIEYLKTISSEKK
ncbi:MAG TPA: cytochrome c oxidase subunit II [Bacteroidales bacterium]|nr:cytochrome c oxidase subunit II [Bacteroidales bacterium]